MKLLKAFNQHIHRYCLNGLLLMVRAYQLLLSPILGSQCRFFPSCSHYCQEALLEHGLGKGLLLTIKRILRCHPGCKGGLDPVPKKSFYHG